MLYVIKSYSPLVAGLLINGIGGVAVFFAYRHIQSFDVKNNEKVGSLSPSLSLSLSPTLSLSLPLSLSLSLSLPLLYYPSLSLSLSLSLSNAL